MRRRIDRGRGSTRRRRRRGGGGGEVVATFEASEVPVEGRPQASGERSHLRTNREIAIRAHGRGASKPIELRGDAGRGRRWGGSRRTERRRHGSPRREEGGSLQEEEDEERSGWGWGVLVWFWCTGPGALVGLVDKVHGAVLLHYLSLSLR